MFGIMEKRNTITLLLLFSPGFRHASRGYCVLSACTSSAARSCYGIWCVLSLVLHVCFDVSFCFLLVCSMSLTSLLYATLSLVVGILS